MTATDVEAWQESRYVYFDPDLNEEREDGIRVTRIQSDGGVYGLYWRDQFFWLKYGDALRVSGSVPVSEFDEKRRIERTSGHFEMKTGIKRFETDYRSIEGAKLANNGNFLIKSGRVLRAFDNCGKIIIEHELKCHIRFFAISSDGNFAACQTMMGARAASPWPITGWAQH